MFFSFITINVVEVKLVHSWLFLFALKNKSLYVHQEKCSRFSQFKIEQNEKQVFKHSANFVKLLN